MRLNTALFSLLLMFVTSVAAAETPAESCDDSQLIYKICTDQKVIYAQKLQEASEQNKLMLVTFGADWCPWCKSLKRIFDQAKGELSTKYVVFEIAVYYPTSGDTFESGIQLTEEIMKLNNLDPKETFKGIPALAVINPQTGKAAFISTGNLEDNSNGYGHDVQKVMAAISAATSEVK